MAVWIEKTADIKLKEVVDMGLFKDYVSQTRKPEGRLGKMMLSGMNSGHAKMADIF